MNKWQAGLLQTLLETGAGYTIQREVIHTQTKGGNINTHKGRSYRQQEVIRYTHTLDQTQSCYTIHTGVYTGC